MISTRTKAVVEAIGISAVVASLVFVGLELRQARAVALSEIDFSLLEIQAGVRALMAEHPDIWIRGADGQPLSSADSLVFHQMVVTWTNIAYFDAQRMNRLGERELAEWIRRDFARRLHKHPGVRAAWLARANDLRAYRSAFEGYDEFDELLARRWAESVLEDLALLDAER